MFSVTAVLGNRHASSICSHGATDTLVGLAVASMVVDLVDWGWSRIWFVWGIILWMLNPTGHGELYRI